MSGECSEQVFALVTWGRRRKVKSFGISSFRMISLCFSVYFAKRKSRWSATVYSLLLRHGEVWLVSRSEMDGQRLGPGLPTLSEQWFGNWYSVTADDQIFLFRFTPNETEGMGIILLKYLFEFWGDIARPSGFQVLKKTVFHVVIILRTFLHLNI